MERRERFAAVAAVMAAALAVPAVGVASSDRRTEDSRGLTVVALADDGSLVTVRADRPNLPRDIERVKGLDGDKKLVGVDFRVQDGKLYGVGDAGGIYTINRQNGRATKVSQLSVALSGTQFGVDFNPAANRLRVVSDTGQNLRHNIDDPMGAPAAGVTAVDGTLTYPATPTVPATTATGVSAAAYTNNDLDVNTATTLYDIDVMLDQVVVQSPANAGLLAATGKLTVDASAPAGFDIYSEVRQGVTVDNTALAVLQADGRSRLLDVDLLTGNAKSLGSFLRGWTVVDVAIPLDQR